MTATELRRHTRYEVQLNCRVSSPVQSFRDLAGVTVNMSRSGMLANFGEVEEADPPPPIGTPVRITVELPGPAGKPPRILECLGRVARIAETAYPRQVAFILQRYQFQGSASRGEAEFNSGEALDGLQ
ncbi:MAG: PilZ domain-containing protein [Bryobacteraceae bacterium]